MDHVAAEDDAAPRSYQRAARAPGRPVSGRVEGDHHARTVDPSSGEAGPEPDQQGQDPAVGAAHLRQVRSAHGQQAALEADPLLWMPSRDRWMRVNVRAAPLEAVVLGQVKERLRDPAVQALLNPPLHDDDDPEILEIEAARAALVDAGAMYAAGKVSAEAWQAVVAPLETAYQRRRSGYTTAPPECCAAKTSLH